MKTDHKDFQSLHKKACEEGKDFYVDPSTGFQVFTEIYHRRRGHCCQSGCRHCPWDFSLQKQQQELKDKHKIK